MVIPHFFLFPQRGMRAYPWKRPAVLPVLQHLHWHRRISWKLSEWTLNPYLGVSYASKPTGLERYVTKLPGIKTVASMKLPVISENSGLDDQTARAYYRRYKFENTATEPCTGEAHWDSLCKTCDSWWRLILPTTTVELGNSPIDWVMDTHWRDSEDRRNEVLPSLTGRNS